VPHPESENLSPTIEQDFLPLRDGDHVFGDENAAVTLVEFGDYECPACGDAYRTIKQLQGECGNGLRYVFRHYPYARLHPHAELAAQAAESAGGQGQFWEMHSLLFENQEALEMENLVSYAEQLNLDLDRFKNELESEKFLEHVRSDFRTGVQNGVFGTPTVFINGIRHNEDLEFETLCAAVKRVVEG
jgi:protein-disulfide isomerase